MTILKNKKVVAIVAVLLMLSAAAGFIWGNGFVYMTNRKPVSVYDFHGNSFNPKVTQETIVMKDKEYLCGDSEKIWEGPAPEYLLNLEKKALEEKFPASEGWAVHFTDQKFLTLTLKADEFCPVHRVYRHLGLYHDMVAVFEGPIGFNEKLLRVENIPVETLNPDIRIKLEQVMDFRKLAHVTVENLRAEFEFKSDDALNAALENLDEHS